MPAPISRIRFQALIECTFDLIELDGEDLRRSAIEHRKHKLAMLVSSPHLGNVLNEHYEGDGSIISAAKASHRSVSAPFTVRGAHRIG
jgi:ATP-dependent DNA ligase